MAYLRVECKFTVFIVGMKLYDFQQEDAIKIVNPSFRLIIYADYRKL
jgi:hypothetical protein